MASALAQKLIPRRDSDLERERFEQLYRETRDDLYGYLRYLLGDAATAEDVLGQSFERAFRKRARFDAARGSARSWLFAIARNAALDELRRRKHDASLSLTTEDAHDHTELTVTRVHVMAALTRLEPRQRELVALKFFGGLANGEIAEVLGISSTNAGTQLHRAIEKMREEMRSGDESIQ